MDHNSCNNNEDNNSAEKMDEKTMTTLKYIYIYIYLQVHAYYARCLNYLQLQIRRSH